MSKYLVLETASVLYIRIMNCKIDTFMRNFIIFIMTFFASNMTLLLSSKSFIRHSLKSNIDLNVNFSRNFQIGVLSAYFDQPSKLLKSWRIYTHFNFQVFWLNHSKPKYIQCVIFFWRSNPRFQRRQGFEMAITWQCKNCCQTHKTHLKVLCTYTVSFKMTF